MKMAKKKHFGDAGYVKTKPPPKLKMTFSLDAATMAALNTLPKGFRSTAIGVAVQQIASFYQKHGTGALGALLMGEFEIVPKAKEAA